MVALVIKKSFKHKGTFLKLLALVTLLTLFFSAIAVTDKKRLLSDTRQHASEALVVYTANLEAELDKYEVLPQVLASFPVFRNGLEQQDKVQFVQAMNVALEKFNKQTNALDTYLINNSGITIAASNWNEETSFISEDLNFRPYFQKAVKEGRADYFALGTSSKKRGHYYASSINNEQGEVLGVLVIKVEMDHLESAWSDSSEMVAVTDADGIIFITTNSEWLYKTLEEIEPARAEMIRDSLRYGEAPLSPLGVIGSKKILGEGNLISVVDADNGQPLELLQQSVAVRNKEWNIHIFSDMTDVQSAVVDRLKLFGALTFLGIGSLFALFYHRKLKLEQARARHEMNESLRSINDRLETQVKERTKELSIANRQLTAEIAERGQTEFELRNTQDQLVQAAKLAALGQMATSISHELNQPLGAIRTFTDTARTYLSLNRKEEVDSNLGLIANMAERMSDIMQHLKAFARKTPLDLVPVLVDNAINETLFMLRPSIAHGQIDIHYQNDNPLLYVRAEPIRLQQVITNLVQNAIDSVAGTDQAKIIIHVTEEETRKVIICVSDTGAGICVDMLDKIFEPFHTTKTVGEGLGLGLSISYGLIKSFDGDIQVRNLESGGAEFKLTLHLANVLDLESA